MESDPRIELFRELLRGLKISSCIVTAPAKHIPEEIDLGFRRDLFGVENYRQFLQNDVMQALPRTLYCFFDEYDCKYIFFQLPREEEPAFLFIGPYLLQMPTAQWLHHLGQTLALTDAQQQRMALYYADLPILEDESSLLNMTGTLTGVISGSMPFSVEYINDRIPDRYAPIPTDSIARGIREPEMDLNLLEENYASEKLLMEAVSKGQLHLLTAAATVYNQGAQPRLNDSLRDRKNYLIILKTLLRKAAEYGGVHPMHIHRLSARYAGEIENICTIKQSLRLQEDMIRSYCLLVKNHSLSRYSYYVGQVITLVQYDLTAELSLKAIAARLNVNASYLSDLFHREYGCTLTDFINKERIGHGLKLLQTTDAPVSQIAAECGMRNPNYFFRLFRQQTGMTPNQYRESSRKQRMGARGYSPGDYQPPS